MSDPGDPLGSTVPGLLVARARAEPARSAIICGDRVLTFAAWDEQSNAVARQLVLRGVGAGDRVALLFSGHDWASFAVCCLGVQKARAVAVPIPDRMAPGQVDGLLEHSGAAAAILGAGQSLPAARELSCSTVSAHDLTQGPTDPLPTGPATGDLAQILYTSGTTAAPKGVSATHANLTHGQSSSPRRRRYAHSTHSLHAFPIGTNAGQLMLIDALVAAPTAIAAGRFEADEFCRLIESYGVGTVFLIPSMAIDMLRADVFSRYDLSSVHLVSSSAAALPPAIGVALATAFPGATIVNYYTSTEAAPAQTTMILDPSRPASVGRPTELDAVMIADEDGKPAAPGEVGEVLLRSSAQPRSYYRDHAATAAVFTDGWVRLGDLGHLDDEGYLYLCDRESDVVKSGGLKISTLQVEAALFEHDEVADAAVVGRPHPVMGAMIAAAVVSRSGAPIEGLHDFLVTRLAREEVPTRVAYLPLLPRNDMGKVDKRALRRHFATEEPAAAVEPSTPTELALALLWRRVLRRPSISAADDFFALGGDSLTATQLASLVAADLGVETQPTLAFDFPVLRNQAAWIDRQAPAERAAPAGSAGADDEATQPALTALQAYFLRWMHQTTPPRTVSAVNAAVRIQGAFDLSLLSAALDQLSQRHPSLRLVFPDASPEGPGAPWLLDSCPPELVVVSVPQDAGEEWEAQCSRLAGEELDRYFDVAVGPLARFVVLERSHNDRVLVIAVHHLVFDGWSMGVLLRELGLTYASLAAGRPVVLPAHGISYDQVTRWAQNQWPEARRHWSHVLDGAPPALLDVPGRKDAQAYTAATWGISVQAGQAHRLHEIGRESGSTMFMVVAACWAATLASWTGATDFVLLSPVPGRTKVEHDSVVGCLVQSLLLRLRVPVAMPFDQLLAQVRRVVLDAVAHQHYPYEEFARQIPYPAWLRYDTWGAGARLPGLDSSPFPLSRDLMLDWPLTAGELDRGVPELGLSEEEDGSLSGGLVYNRRAFDVSDIARLGERFSALVAALVQRPEGTTR